MLSSFFNSLITLQNRIAVSSFTLPVTCGLGLLLWFLPPFATVVGRGGLLLGLVVSAVSVWLLTELNVRTVLLRVSSRLACCLFVVLLASVPALHSLQAAHALLVLSLLSFFTLFPTYKNPHPLSTYLTYFFLSLSSAVLPVAILLVPAYWLFQAYLLGMSHRCFVASLLGLATPYWLWFGLLICLDDYATLSGVAARFAPSALFASFSLAAPVGPRVCQLLPALLLFAGGAVNFRYTARDDKVRIRAILTVVISHAVFVLFMQLCLPDSFVPLLPLFMVDAAILGGRLLAQSFNRFSALVFFLFSLLTVFLLFL